MAFTPKQWQDGSGGGTPLDAAALIDAEQRLGDYADATVATETAARTSADTAHAADTTDVHGIADATVLATDAEVTAAVEGHRTDTTDVHGIADTSVLATDSDVATAVAGKLDASEVGQPDGVASLGADGLVPGSQLPAAGGGSGHEIRDEGVALTARAALNFIGASVAVADDPVNDRTNVTVSVPPASPSDLDAASLGIYDAGYYGVKADARRVTDAVTTASSAIVTSATASFTAADVGKTISITGAGTAGVPHVAAINSVQSATQVTMNSSAPVAVSNAFLAVGTDDTEALKLALASIAGRGGGVLLLDRGLSITTAVLRMWSYVSVVGRGMDQSGILPCTNSSAFSNMGFGQAADNPTVGATYRDFEIDGRAQQLATYTWTSKAFYGQYYRRCHWIRLHLHHTPATGLGVDYLADGCTIRDNVIYGCGRQAPSDDPDEAGTAGLGGAGIGIGAGGYDVEDVTISGNHCYDNHNWNIFLEAQPPGTLSKGARISDNVCVGGGQLASIGDRGTFATIIANNVVLNAVGHGIRATRQPALTHSKDGSIHNNYVEGALYDGIRIEVGDGPYSAAHNRSRRNQGVGLRVVATANLTAYGIDLESNKVSENVGGGIVVEGPSTATVDGLTIQGGRVTDNGTLASPKPGILLSSLAAPYLTVTGVRVRDSRPGGAKTQTHGVQATGGGSLANALIEGNDLRNNATAETDFGTSATAGAIITRNPT